jgi:hypothetical protein
MIVLALGKFPATKTEKALITLLYEEDVRLQAFNVLVKIGSKKLINHRDYLSNETTPTLSKKATKYFLRHEA